MSLACLFTSRSPSGHHSTSQRGKLQPSERINLAASGGKDSRAPHRHGGLGATYIVCVDQMAHEEVAAAAAARHELGPGYDEAVAEGLVERIGSEIDKRVDARLALRNAAPPATRTGWGPAVIGAGSMVCGLGSTAIVVFATATNINGSFHNTLSRDQILLVALIWAVIAVVNVAYAAALSVRSRSGKPGR